MSPLQLFRPSELRGVRVRVILRGDLGRYLHFRPKRRHVGQLSQSILGAIFVLQSDRLSRIPVQVLSESGLGIINEVAQLTNHGMGRNDRCIQTWVAMRTIVKVLFCFRIKSGVG